jgi:hypothetical protein
MLPPKLECLHFKSSIRILAGALPDGLKTLIVEGTFHALLQDLPTVLPTSLEYLKLQICFSVRDLLIPTFPTGLKHLDIYIYDCHDLDGLLPSQLTTLVLRSDDFPTVDYPLTFPASLRRLEIYCDGLALYPRFLPASLEYLTLSSITNDTIDASLLPSTLLELDIKHTSSSNFTFARNALPASLQVLGLPSSFTSSITTLADDFVSLPNLRKLLFTSLQLSNDVSASTLPASVKSLSISIVYDPNVHASLSELSIDNLELFIQNERDITTKFNGNILPRMLKKLCLWIQYMEILPRTLPESLEELLIEYYTEPFHAGVLPSNLKVLHLPGDYEHLLQHLPVGLQHLYICSGEYIVPCGYFRILCAQNFDRVPRIDPAAVPANLEVHMVESENRSFRVSDLFPAH